MTESRFYETNPNDPDAPVLIEEHDGMCIGDVVRYIGPVPLMVHPLVVTEFIRWPGDELVSAILNDGEFEVNADNLALQTWSEDRVNEEAVESVQAFMVEHPEVDVAGYEPDPALSMTEDEYNARHP